MPMEINETPKDDSEQGERVSPHWTITWIDPKRIEAGECIAPAALASKPAREYSALSLILLDLNFSYECFSLADEKGVPNDKDTISKSLIYSGVVGYARCFKSGVREIRLEPEKIKLAGGTFDDEAHEYLIALRDKHVAHSVNDFELCQTVAAMIRSSDGEWRDGSGVGVVVQQTVGMNRALVRKSMQQIKDIQSYIESELAKKRLKVYAAFKEHLDQGGKWEIAPLVTVTDRKNVSKRRK